MSSRDDKYDDLVLRNLEDIRQAQKDLVAYFKDHDERDAARYIEMRERLLKIEQDKMWVSKLWAAGISAAITGFSLLFKPQ